MSSGRWRMLGLVLLAAAAVAANADALPVDSLSLGSVGAVPGTTARVPVYLRDASGTRLGRDFGAHPINLIQFTATFTHSELVKGCLSTPFPQCSVRFVPDGVLAAPTPESLTVFKGSQTLLVRYTHSPAPQLPDTQIDFTPDKEAPGNLIGYIEIDLLTFSTDLQNTIQITLRPGPDETLLANQLNAAITETVGDELEVSITPAKVIPTQCAVTQPGIESIAWSGDRGCSTEVSCSIDENVTFHVLTSPGYTLQDCDSATWDFNDGTSVYGTTVTHAFSAGGSFKVSLEVKNVVGSGSAGTVVAVSSTVGTSSCTSCSATVPIDAATNRIVDFLSTFPNGCSPQVAWTFGDGDSVGTRNASHVYRQPGTYPWSMTLSTGTDRIRTGMIAIASGTATCLGDCSANVPAKGVAGSAVPFGAVVGCEVGEYQWFFGDGSTKAGSEAAVTHQYAAAGTYDWKLTVMHTGMKTTNCSLGGRVVITAQPPPSRRHPFGLAE